MKISDIPTLDCREKENVKFLITKFNEMSPVKSKGLNYKDDFKNDFDKLTKLVEMILDKKKFHLSGISFWSKRQNTFLTNKNDKSIKCTFVSKNLNELFLKICVYCYYKKIGE